MARGLFTIVVGILGALLPGALWLPLPTLGGLAFLSIVVGVVVAPGASRSGGRGCRPASVLTAQSEREGVGEAAVPGESDTFALIEATTPARVVPVGGQRRDQRRLDQPAV